MKRVTTVGTAVAVLAGSLFIFSANPAQAKHGHCNYQKQAKAWKQFRNGRGNGPPPWAASNYVHYNKRMNALANGSCNYGNPGRFNNPALMNHPLVQSNPSLLNNPHVLNNPALLNHPAILANPAILSNPSLLTSAGFLNNPNVINGTWGNPSALQSLRWQLLGF